MVLVELILRSKTFLKVVGQTHKNDSKRIYIQLSQVKI